jgi:hypothetical protein
MAGPLTYLIPASQLRRDVRVYGRKDRSTLFGGSSLLRNGPPFFRVNTR